MQSEIFYLQSQISSLQAQLSDIADEMKSIKEINQAKPTDPAKTKDSDLTELKSKMIQRLMFIQNEAKDEKTSEALGVAIETLVNSLLLEIIGDE